MDPAGRAPYVGVKVRVDKEIKSRLFLGISRICFKPALGDGDKLQDNNGAVNKALSSYRNINFQFLFAFHG